MSAILLYSNRKQPVTAWAFTTPEEKIAAYLALFGLLDEVWKVYDGTLSLDERTWHALARKGDVNAALRLLKAREDYEYEEWQVIQLEETT